MKKLIKVNLIEKFMKEKGLSKTGFCKLCEISYCTLKKILSDDGKFRVTAIFKVAKAMGFFAFELLY